MYIKIYKSFFDNKKCVSHKMFFPVVAYIMLVNNYYGISYFSIGNIMDYLKIERTTRNLKSLAECISTMESEQLLIQVFGDNILDCNMNSLVGFEVFKSSDVEKYNQLSFEELDTLLEIYSKNESNFIIANIFLTIKRYSFSEQDIKTGIITDKTTVSYSTISKTTNIKSPTTISKYISILEDYGLFKVERDTTVETKIIGNDKKQIFKTINTYYFKERNE